MSETAVNIIYKSGFFELIEKKSRFLGFVQNVGSEAEARNIIDSTRKKYWDARHVCYAYIIGSDRETFRFCDDGEPSQTAGKPIMDVISGANATNVLAVVVRYFGGVLLGTGGLVKAYSSCAKGALQNSVMLRAKHGRMLCITSDYAGLNTIQHLLSRQELVCSDISYLDRVTLKVPVELSAMESTKKLLTDATGASAVLTEEEDVMYAFSDGKLVLL